MKNELRPISTSLPDELSLQVNFSWTLLGNIVHAVFRWGILITLAKFGTPSMVGEFAFGLAIVEPIFMFTNLQLRSVLATDANTMFFFEDYLTVRILSSIFGLLILYFISVNLSSLNEMMVLILLLALTKGIDSVSDIFYGFFQLNERMDLVAKSMIIKGPVAWLLFALILYFTGELSLSVIGICLSGFFTLLIYDIKTGYSFILKIKQKKNLMHQENLHSLTERIRNKFFNISQMRILLISLPLGGVMMLISLNDNISRYFIEYFLGDHSLGIFAAISYFVVAGSTLVKAIGQSAIARMAKFYFNGDYAKFKELLIKLFQIALAVGIAGMFCAWAFGHLVLELAYGEEYAEHVNIFTLTMAWATFFYLSSILGYGMTSTRKFMVQIPIFIASSAATAMACLWLIPQYGLKGAVFSVFSGTVVQILFGSLVIKHSFKEMEN